jgi:hypothetical protein
VLRLLSGGSLRPVFCPGATDVAVGKAAAGACRVSSAPVVGAYPFPDPPLTIAALEPVDIAQAADELSSLGETGTMIG